MFNEESLGTGERERIVAGTRHNGMVIDATKDGIEISAFYQGLKEETLFAVLREPVKLPWEEIDKLRVILNKDKKAKKAHLLRTEKEVDDDYLETLPVVTINSSRYYIDPVRRERRPVNNPNKVWGF